MRIADKINKQHKTFKKHWYLIDYIKELVKKVFNVDKFTFDTLIVYVDILISQSFDHKLNINVTNVEYKTI
jgi:hypothetical protein